MTVSGIRINRSQYTNYSGCTVETISYDDYVFCVELPKWHTLWVMRDCKTSWNGNCRCYATFFIKEGPLEQSFSDFKEEEKLSNGKPDILWTKDNLRKKLSGLVDSEEELDNLADGIWEYMNDIENRNEESISAMGHDYKLYCNHFTIKSHKGVDLCPEGSEESDKRGLFFVIHNHPSNNPLHSEGDIMGFAAYGIKYNIVFTEKEGLFILKNEEATKNGIKQGWNDIYQFMLEDFKTNNPEEYNYILDLVNHAGLDDDLYDSLLYDKVIDTCLIIKK